MQVAMFIAALVTLGALAAAFDADSSSERSFDLISAAVAAGVFCITALVHRSRTGVDELKGLLKGPARIILVYAFLIPALAYWLVSRALHLGATGKEILAIVVALGGYGLAMARWERGG